MSKQINDTLHKVDMNAPARMYRLVSPALLRTLMDRTGDGSSVTIRALAAAAGCAKSTVGALLSGDQASVPEDTAYGIARRIGVDLLVLFTPDERTASIAVPTPAASEAVSA